MIKFAAIKSSKPTKHKKKHTVETIITQSCSAVYMLGRNRLLLLFGFLFLWHISYSQTYSDVLDQFHSKGSKSIGVHYSIGENNSGITANLGFSILDDFSLNANFGKRAFNLREYSEDILEGGLEARYVIYSLNDRYISFLKGVSFSGGLGFIKEFVKNTSTLILADPYPDLTYITGAIYMETSLYRGLKLTLYGRQWYGVAGDTEIIGKQRYDIGLGLTYYFF